MKKTMTVATIAWLALALASPTVVLTQAPPAGAIAEVERYQIGTALPPVPDGREMVSLTLQQAIDRALERNLDIQSARLNPEIQNYSLIAARAAFSPTISTSLSKNNQTRQSTSQLDGGARTSTNRWTLNSGFSQTLPWYGGRLSADFNNSRSETNNSFTTLNPSYSSSVSFSYNQPLLSGFRTDNQRTALRTQEIQGQITDIQLTSQIENIVSQIRSAYWGLRAQIEQIEIQRLSLAQAQQLLEDNRTRVALGTMAEIQVVQAEAQVAGAEQSLLNAQIQFRNQELAFKRLLINGADDPLLNQTINPTEFPVLETQDIDIDAAVEYALRERTDIRQARQQQQVSELNLEVTKDASKPDLSLGASYSLSGVGGNLFERGELGGEPVLVEEGGYFDGLNAIASRDTPTWNLSLNFSYPIGMKAAKANLERAELQLRQTELSIRSQELAIVSEVISAGLSVNDTRLQLDAAQRSRELAEDQLAAEVTRFNAGVATNFEVVGAQDALTSARLSELRALINHINAIEEFDLIQRVGR